MRTRRVEVAASVQRLRVHGAGPDPRFRAGLRERLVAAATTDPPRPTTGADPGEDARDPGQGHGPAKAVD